MNRSTHFLAGGLAAVAVASGITFTAPAAQADDAAGRPCGQPAVPAHVVTVVREPVLRLVPAVTHEEWRWEREVTTYEHEFSKVLSAASSETDWTREVPGTTEYQWALKVVDQAAVPAVPGSPEEGHFVTVVITPAVTETMIEYVNHQTGRTRWMPTSWNASDVETQGWYRTGNTREDVVTPAVTEQQWVVDEEAVDPTPAVEEVSHLEYTWATSSPGGDWTGPVDSRVVGGGTETTTTLNGALPDGDGWTPTGTRHHDEVLDTVWAAEAPDGYAATGASRVASVSTEQTTAYSATPSTGDGWVQVPGALVVVDQEATTEVVVEGSTEQVEVSPELPATEPCLAAASSSDQVASASAAAQHSAATMLPAPHAPAHQGHQTTVAAAAAGLGATVLPAAGNAVSPLLVTTGLGALLAGGVLVGVGRRRQAD